MYINLKTKLGKAFYGILVLYYIIDIYFTKGLSPLFMFLFTNIKFGFNFGSLGGLALIIHWGFIAAFIPGIIFSIRGARWAKRLIRIYLRTTVVFFGIIFYANLKGGGVLSPGYALNFILTTMIFALGIGFFLIMWKDKKVEMLSAY